MILSQKQLYQQLSYDCISIASYRAGVRMKPMSAAFFVQVSDNLLTMTLLVISLALVYIFCSLGEHCIDQTRQFMGYRGNGFLLCLNGSIGDGSRLQMLTCFCVMRELLPVTPEQQG
jgi:hypothetical protein